MEKNEGEVASFQVALTDTLKRLANPLDAGLVHVFVQDESRFGLLPGTRKRIILKGVKPIQPVQHTFEHYSLYGAMEPTTGEKVFLELPALNSECFQIFLEHFAVKYAERVCLLVPDDGAFHKAKRLVIPNNMVFLFLPSYAPELNSIERV